MAYELITTSGIFALDGGEWEVENNIWIVGDDRSVVVFDAAHDHRPIVEAVGERSVEAIVCTHGHNDHINAAVALKEVVDAPIVIHPADAMLWSVVYPDIAPDGDLEPGDVVRAGPHSLSIVHTPGHSPGCCCFYDSSEQRVLSGDTLFCGGPGATGRSFSDEPTILRSISERLLSLPDTTRVHTGHGDMTTIGDERQGVVDRIAELGLSS